MSSDPAGKDRMRWRSREDFLGGAGLADDVRPSIARSWVRSRESGVRPDDRSSLPAVEFDPDVKLLRVARPVLDRLADEVADVDMTVILTDPRGLVLDRRAGSPALRRGLDRVHLAPSHSYGEEMVGTNGIGTAAEDMLGLGWSTPRRSPARPCRAQCRWPRSCSRPRRSSWRRAGNVGSVMSPEIGDLAGGLPRPSSPV